MPYEAMQPRNSRVEQTTRQREPYHFQRDRQFLNKQPRPPQAGVQPNRLPRPTGWGMTTREYFEGVFQDYLRRRKGV